MTHENLSFRIAIAKVTACEPLNDFLFRTQETTDKKYNTFVRISAREQSGAANIPEGCDTELCVLIGENKGAEVSTIVVIEDEAQRKAFISAVSAKIGAKVPFSIYTAKVADFLADEGKTGAAIENADGKRYVNLQKAYYGADANQERKSDAFAALKASYKTLRESDFKPAE